MEPRIFRSKIDAWFIWVVGLATAISIWSLAPQLAESSPGETWLGFAALLVVIGLPGWLMLNTRYRVDLVELTVTSGPFRWRIPLKDIESVEPSRSAISSPALSLDRLKIYYGNGKQLQVSPLDQQGFLEALGQLSNC